MADKKISQLTELAGNQIDYDNDVIAIVDNSAGEIKKTSLTSVFSNVPAAASTTFGDINAVSANIGTGRFIVNSTNNGFVQMGSYGTGKFFQDQTASLATRFTLGINSEGKITEDQKIATFKISGSGFMNMNSKPKVLVPAPGTGKYILPFEIFVYQQYQFRPGFSNMPNNQPVYAIGTIPNIANPSVGFQQLWGLHKTPATSYTHDVIAYRAVPIVPNKAVLENTALILRQGSDHQSLMGTFDSSNPNANTQYPGGQHFISIRYMILDKDQDFKNFPSVQEIVFSGNTADDT